MSMRSIRQIHFSKKLTRIYSNFFRYEERILSFILPSSSFLTCHITCHRFLGITHYVLRFMFYPFRFYCFYRLGHLILPNHLTTRTPTEYCVNNRNTILLFSNLWIEENSVFYARSSSSIFLSKICYIICRLIPSYPPQEHLNAQPGNQ